jgi:hypothetical protein
MRAVRAFFKGRPTLFVLWSLLLIGSALALLRMSVFMFDPARVSFSLMPANDFLRNHSCLSAYVAAGDLVGDPNAHIYDPANYERHAPDATRRMPIYGFEQDKYEYPPPFLLLPKALLLVTRDFRWLRFLWFIVVTASLISGAALTARWIGGRRGLATALLIPFALVNFASLGTIQTGNVHFVIIMMCVVAMIAFEMRRPALGGALLAFAIGAKIFPGLLVLWLLVQRRFREILWTAGFGLLYCIAVLAIGGTGPFVDFVGFQLPRLASGEAFAFFKEKPDSIASNLSFYGIPYRLQLLGLVQSPDALASVVSRAYTALLVVLTPVIAWKSPKPAPTDESDDRAGRAIQWLAIVSLAGLQSPFSPPYTVLGFVWLLTLWAPGWRHFGRAVALFVAGFLGLTLIIPAPLMALIISSSVVQITGVGIGLAALLRPSAGVEPARAL